MTKIEEFVGGLEIFRMILEGSFARWEGTFDVMPVDPPPVYLFESRVEFAEFCKKVRSVPEGRELCMECDRKHAALAGQQGEPIHYLCHAGMLDVAVPVLVEDELVATIFCGQCRSWNKKEEKKGRKRAIETAQKLGFAPRELPKLRKRARQVSSTEIEDVKQRLLKVATYVATMGHDRLELLVIRSEMLRESQHIQNVMNTFTTIVDVDAFWPRLDTVLERICSVIGADYAAVFVSRNDDEEPYRLRSFTGLGREHFREYYPGNQATNDEVIGQRTSRVFDFDPSTPDTLCYDLAAVQEHVPDKVAVVPVDLSGEQHAVMVFFLDTERDIEGSLPIEKEVEILSQVAPQIAVAYQNCELYTRQKELAGEQKELAREKDVFLEDVAHQLIAPLSGIHADSDRLDRYLQRWDEQRVANQVKAIKGTSRWAARLTRNLLWVATTGGHTLHKRRRTDMARFLIGCAIDVQGIAAYRNLRVHVDEASTDALPKLFMDQERFAQAVVNLLDNAVKYSRPGGDIVVNAEHFGTHVHIHVTNYGIPLRKEDVERIFERGYRTKEAEEQVPGGTGIGLSVAREIVRLHGGELLARPSTYDRQYQAHKVVFTIVFPVKPKEVKS